MSKYSKSFKEEALRLSDEIGVKKPAARELLSVAIQTIIDSHPDNDNYGVNRMRTALAQGGIIVSKRTVCRSNLSQ